MAKKIKDGWHEFYGQDVYVENGYIIRGLKYDRNGYGLAAYVYRKCKDGTGYDRVDKITPAAFRAAWNRDTIILA